MVERQDLHTADVDPAPRRTGPTRREFPAAQTHGTIAADFPHIDTMLGTRLYALVFLEHGTRRLHITGITAHSTRAWTAGQEPRRRPRHPHRVPALPTADRDSKYGEAFDAVFEADELRVLTSAPRSPRMNAHCERVVGSIRREVLDHVLVAGEAHARQILKTYEVHYNRHRPHQAHDQLPPEAQEHPCGVPELCAGSLSCGNRAPWTTGA
ncbi:integrase [Saccharothrix sp. ALI-22-I]|uniref:integrase core domain-containing protein n=1 Tax=Saccharothrix sp. ALI-22-I TaxID=1933778 RepID=UPI00097BB1D4|nr:integrase core domain-containing protein [Saccharothrix sp. ALI-22-I]ONI92621.1 integrase [Saccharothrix sp. ALI-22-I]